MLGMTTASMEERQSQLSCTNTTATVMRVRFLQVLAVLVGLAQFAYAGCCLKKMTFPDPPSTSNYAQLNAVTPARLNTVTACLQLRTSNTSVGTLFSYAASVNHTDEMVFSGNAHGEYTLTINGTSTDEIYLDVHDGRCHTVCFTWKGSNNGRWSFYVDGEQVIQDDGLASGHVIRTGGTWILAQRQRSLGGSFNESEAYNGADLSCFNVWNYILTPGEADLTRRRCGIGGNVFDWSRQSWTTHGSVTLIDNQCDAFRHPIMLASSQFDSFHGPANGILDFEKTSLQRGAWVPAQADVHQWLRVDLSKTYFVTALVTQGRNNYPCDQVHDIYLQWVSSYYITYGADNGDKVVYKDDDELMIVFPGNADGDVPVRHELSDYSGPIAARYVMFHPLSWVDWIAMRAGLVVHSALEPVGRWPLNEQYGAMDATGNGNDGITSGTELVEGLTGPQSQAFLFSGPEASYINITNNGKLDVRYAYTILAHIYPTGEGRGPLFAYKGPESVLGFFWLWDFKLHLSSVRRDGQFSSYYYGCSHPVDDSHWHYVGASYSIATGIQSIWLESARVSGRIIGTRELATQQHVIVGRQTLSPDNIHQFIGRISCLQLYDYAMDAHQMAVVRETCETTCPYGWYPAGFVCYKAFDELVNWETANKRCGREGGRLATVKDADTNRFLVALKNTLAIASSFWIGLKRENGIWVWSDGTPLGAFRVWGQEGIPDCVSYWPHLWRLPLLRSTWATNDCTTWMIKFICERVETPKSLTCSSQTPDSILLHWMYPYANLSAYHIWYQHSAEDQEPTEFMTSLPMGSHSVDVTIDGLESNSKYNVTVRAVVGTTESLDVKIQCTTLNSIPLPEGLQVTSITETSIQVSWIQTSNALVIAYRVWIRRSDTGESVFTHLLPTTKTVVTFEDLMPSMEYIISAINIYRHQEGPEANLTVATKTDPPGSLEAVDWTIKTITISWLPPKAVLIGYNITYTGRGGSSLITKPGDVDRCELTGLVPGTRYTIDVVAVSRLGRSVTVSTSAVTDTDPPSGLKVITAGSTWMFLAWEAPSANIVYYDLDISDEDGRAKSWLSIEGHSTSYNVTDLLSETEYVIKMAAFSEYGRSVVITCSHSTGALYPVEVGAIADGLSDIMASSRPSLLLTTSRAGQNIEATTSLMNTPEQFDLGGHSTTNVPQTTAASDTSPETSTEFPLILQTSQPGSTVYTTSQYKTTGGIAAYTDLLERATEGPEAKLNQLAQGIDGTVLDAARPDDILEMATNINDIIETDTKSSLSSPVLKTTAKLVRMLAEATRGLQGASVDTMKAITNVMMQTASTALAMVPEEAMVPIPSHVDNLFENDLIDILATDISPKQQLKMLRDEQKEREDTEQLVALSMVESLDQVADTLLMLQPENLEYQARFETEDISLVVAKPISSENVQIESGNIVVHIPAMTSAERTQDILGVKMAVFKKNPYSWSDLTGGQNISSAVVVLTMNVRGHQKNQRVNLDFPLVHSKTTAQPTTVQPHVTTKTPHTIKGNGTAMTYHAFHVPDDDVIPIVTMSWRDVRATFHVYTMDGSRPTVQKYAEKRVVQVAGLEAWFAETEFSFSFVPNTTARGGVLYVGVLELGPVDDKGYNLQMKTVACSSWKDRQKLWSLEDCQSTVRLNDGTISCTCDMAESRIAAGTKTLPVPNSINFINAFQNFRNLGDNAMVFSIVVTEFVLYIILMVLLRKDFKRKWSGRATVWSQFPLKELHDVSLIPPDRMPAPHVYQLTVTTGSMFGAGTTSRVGLHLYGSKGTTPIKMLNPNREALVRGSTLHFIMPVRESLGELTSLHIWHDNSGEGDTSSWFLRTVLVRDVETDDTYYFICNKWLSETKGDCEVQMAVNASTEEELRSFPNVFSEATRDVFYDAQLWVSALLTSPGSSFTRAQRLSCCFTLLNTMMLSSAMWYREDNTTAGATVYNLGVVQITTEELYISLMSTLTVAPINLLIVKLFRWEAPLSVNTPEMVVHASQGFLRRAMFRLARYVAWVAVFLVSTSSAFFVMLYSMDWGKEKSDSWMKAFLLSFMGSSCVMETLQIFAMAVVLAAVCGLPFLTKLPAIKKDDMQLNLWNTRVPKKVYPPVNANRQWAKKKKDLSKKSASVLMELFLLFVFVGVLFYIAQASNDEMGFYETQSLSNSILQEHYAIRTPDQFYSWLEETLLPTLYPASWYNGCKMKFLDRQFAQNTESFRLGPPRLVQVRQLPGTKTTDNAGLGWTSLVGNVSDNCWRFAVPDLGNHPDYNSACTNHHSLDFPLDASTSASVFSTLKDFEYVDKYTESLEIDMNFYNPNLKQFSVVKIFVDHPDIGNLMPTSIITAFKMFQYESGNDYVHLLLHIVFVILFLVMLYKAFKSMKEQGWTYFTSPWNILECVVLIGTVMIISVFIKRYTVASATLDMVAKTNGELGFANFVDLSTAALWDSVFKHILGAAVFFNTIALIRVVRFSQTISKLLALPSIMKKELTSFLVVASIAFVAFIGSGHLIFVCYLESYTDLYRTTIALFEMMLGAFVTDHVMETNPLLGPIYFSAFMILVFILLVNFLVTIICDVISADVEVNHDLDLADHMWRSFLAMLGIHNSKATESKPSEVKMEELHANLRIVLEKLDESLDICDSILPSSRQRDSFKMEVSNTPTRATRSVPCPLIKVTTNVEPVQM